jgi:L-fuconolactonase
MTAIVDAHQHFWNYGTYQTSWVEKPPYAGDPAFAQTQRSFGPADLQPELQAAGVFASVTVQPADSSEENDILLAHAAQTPWIAGVVGWIPLGRPDEAALRGLERPPSSKAWLKRPQLATCRNCCAINASSRSILRS